ncbi:hypothetical protein BC629DRAFT_1440673 [Irpex lacteus]|nr:hypothetical protein BC629DRAFT_1440673 [Irpex lacteus]
MARGFAHWTWKPAAELVFARRRRFVVRSPGSSEVEETFVERGPGVTVAPQRVEFSTCNGWTSRLDRETNIQNFTDVTHSTHAIVDFHKQVLPVVVAACKETLRAIKRPDSFSEKAVRDSAKLPLRSVGLSHPQRSPSYDEVMIEHNHNCYQSLGWRPHSSRRTLLGMRPPGTPIAQ